jgi:hypothetical protein
MTSEHLLNLQRIGQLDAVPFSAELMDNWARAQRFETLSRIQGADHDD